MVPLLADLVGSACFEYRCVGLLVYKVPSLNNTVVLCLHSYVCFTMKGVGYNLLSSEWCVVVNIVDLLSNIILLYCDKYQF